MRATLAVWAVCAACGDNEPVRPMPLVPDPAIDTTCSPGPLTAGATRAKPIACAGELIPGRLAGGRVGDYLLENDRIRVIVRGAGEGWFLQGSSGGGIVDAAAVGGEDLVKEIEPSIDFAAGAFGEIVITHAGGNGTAELVVRGPAANLDLVQAALPRDPPAAIIEHHYRLRAGATAVELETRVFPQAGATLDPPTLYDAMFFGGRARAFIPGQGFTSGNTGGEMIATDGTTSSYALVYPISAPLPQLVGIGGIRLVQGPPIDTTPVLRWLVIGDGSVASTTEAAWKLRGVALGEISGTTAAGVDVVVRDGSGATITIARADASGAYRVAVPAGAYSLAAEGIGRMPGAQTAVTVAGGGSQTLALPPGAAGVLAISVRDDDSGAPIPARVVIEQGSDRRIAWVDASGDLSLAAPPGSLRVSISRGLEYDAFVADPVAVADGQTVPISARLARVVDTAGWISIDTHLHSEFSTDSTFPIDDRLRAVAAEGVEIAVSSDHDFVVDYTPILAELGLSSWVATFTGEEASSLGWGHLNAWPLAVDSSRAGGGAPRWLGHSPSEVFALLRGGDAERIVQVNHPRYSASSLFNAIDLDPATLTARRDPSYLGLPEDTNLSDLDFDTVEVANGLASSSFEEVFADWLAMVAAGHRAAAVGSSDSHGASAYAGEARTFVWVGAGADDPRTVDPRAIDAAIRARHVTVGTCAFVTAGIAGSLPGDAVDVAAGAPTVALHVRVQAPPWQPLDQIRVFQGPDRVVATIALDHADTAAIRYDADIAIATPTADTAWVVRVDPAGPGTPVLSDPMPALTNPVFVHPR